MQLGQKLPTLKKQLSDYAGRYRGQPYKLGYHDCLLFCLRWADLRNSTNLKSLYNYSGDIGAAEMLKREGVINAFDLFDHHFARTLYPVEGDLVGWAEGIHGGCGIVTDTQFVTIQSTGGVSLTDEKYYRAWTLDG